MNDLLERLFLLQKEQPTDIHEHLDTLAHLASECSLVVECGVRTCVSTYAFLWGLRQRTTSSKVLICCDIAPVPVIDAITALAEDNGILLMFFQMNDLDLPLHSADMVFLDTWHVYGHMRRELDKFGEVARKYIVMHDTSIDAFGGESIREAQDIPKLVEASGYPEAEIREGIWPAIEEFLAAHPEWVIKTRYTNCNGLTVLERAS